MHTPLLATKLLILGSHSGIWIVYLGLSILIFQWPEKFQWLSMSNWQTLVSMILLCFCYLLSIIIHQLVDTIFSSWENRIRGEMAPASSILTNKLRLGLVDEALTRQIESTRSRMRIARAFVSNFGLTTIFAMGFIAIQWQTLTFSKRWGLLFFVLIVGVILMGAATITWHSFTRRCYEMVKKHLDADSP